MCRVRAFTVHTAALEIKRDPQRHRRRRRRIRRIHCAQLRSESPAAAGVARDPFVLGLHRAVACRRRRRAPLRLQLAQAAEA